MVTTFAETGLEKLLFMDNVTNHESDHITFIFPYIVSIQ